MIWRMEKRRGSAVGGGSTATGSTGPLALILMGVGIQTGRRIYQLAEKAADDIEHGL
jgi:hypothetical protein